MTNTEHAVGMTPTSHSSGFLWLELTNQCNLQCVHCYAESGPHTGHKDRLQRADYERLIAEGFEMGYREIQFIGGEPTLHPDLPHFIKLACETGYTFIEVFSNLTRVSDALLECLRQYGVHVATSVYAADEEAHDAVTRVRGSFWRTTRSLERLIAAGIPVRAGTIEMEQNSGRFEETTRFLNNLGVDKVGRDRLRHFGRGAADGHECLDELCGNCAGNTLCVAPDGRVSPCIMSKAWSVGSVLEQPLAELARSQRLRSLRSEIHEKVVAPRLSGGHADGAGFEAQCDPNCNPYCSPGQQCFPCNPNGGNPCGPNGRPCFPH